MIEILIVVSLILAGLVLVWFAKFADLQIGEPSKTAIILAPLILYIFLSGKLTEFEGLGWKAKFRNITTENIVKAARTSDLATVSEQMDPANFTQEALWGMCRPYYLLTNASAKDKNNPKELDRTAVLHIATALRVSLLCGKFVALIVVDATRKPIGFFSRDHFQELLRVPLVAYDGLEVDGNEAFRQIAGSELGVILRYPDERAKSDEASHASVSAYDDIETVYKKMISSDIKIALITDRLGRFDGIITRSAIEGKLIEGLLAASK